MFVLFSYTLAPLLNSVILDKYLHIFNLNYIIILQASFNIACIATIVERNFDYFAQDDFRVRNPDIKITYEGKPVARQEFTVTVKVENPLPIPLKNGKFYIQGAGLDKQLKIELNEVNLILSSRKYLLHKIS